MKVFLGAITAAALFGVGCAHNREASKQTEMPGSPQASVGGAQQVPGYSCVVVDSSASGISQSTTMEGQPQAGGVPGGVQQDQDQATGGSAPGGGVPGGVQQDQDQATGGAAPGGGVSGGVQQDQEQDQATGGAAPKTDTYDDTGMGGGGGGGG